MDPTLISLQIPDNLLARLTELAEADGIALDAYIVQSLEEAADRSDERGEQLRAGLLALDVYMRGGISYGFDETAQYMLGIAAGKDMRRPQPSRQSSNKRS